MRRKTKNTYSWRAGVRSGGGLRAGVGVGREGGRGGERGGYRNREEETKEARGRIALTICYPCVEIDSFLSTTIYLETYKIYGSTFDAVRASRE